MLGIAVLDDEAMYIDRISQITEECMEKLGVEYELHAYEAGRDVLEDLEKGVYYDIYLLDMQLPDMHGLEIAKEIRRRFAEPILIYITNYVNYAVEAYEVNTYRYIPKQMLKEKLTQAYFSLKPLLKAEKSRDRFYTVERYKDKEKIYYSDIIYLKKDRKYVIFVHKGGKSRVRKSLGEILEEMQAKEFLQIDRSYVVNINYVKTVKGHELWLENGEILSVSKAKWPHVRDAFMNWGR